MTLQVKLDTTEVNAELDRLIQSARDMRSVFTKMGTMLVGQTQLNLGHGLDAWGNPFAPLKATRGRRIGSVPLNDTRQHIYNRIARKADANSVTIGILENSPIGATHQFGSAKKNIPARPFLPIRPNGTVDLPANWSEAIIETIKAHFSSRYTN